MAVGNDPSQSTTTLNQDPSSVYYIHPSDSLAQQVVSAKLNGEGYGDWKRYMLITLPAKNKVSFVEGSLQVPTVGMSIRHGRGVMIWLFPGSMQILMLQFLEAETE